ncbi:MAG: amidohydrolase family protein, partial [Syntrophorhabdaceae bacterium]|nr:amidohydrolase family protein [Syntrophorhabdaceae bacterium]
MDIIDFHTHIFPPEVISDRDGIIARDPRFEAIYRGSKEKLIDARGLVKYMDDNNIISCIACSFPFLDSGLLKTSNDYTIEASRLDPRIIPFIACDPYKRTWSIREIDRCFRNGAKGIGEIGVYEKGLGKKEIKGLEDMAKIAVSQGLPIIIHVNEQIGHIYNGKTIIDFVALTDFIKRNPLLKIVLAHLGGGLCFYEFMPEIRDTFKNVYYDTAALPFIYS